MLDINYFKEIGDEVDIIVNEINGPSWSPKKDKISIENLQEISEQNDRANELEIIKSNANSIKAVAMIRSYRQRGHLIAKLDPLGMMKSEYLDELHPESYGCLLYTSPSPRDLSTSRMPSSA